MMTFHRFLYKLCWRTKLFLPLLFLVCVVAMMLLLVGSGGHLEYTAEGKLRIQYDHGHNLQSKNEDAWQKEGMHDYYDHDMAPGGVRGESKSDALETQYLNANIQNALLFKANMTKELETDPLLKDPLLEKIYLVRKPHSEGQETMLKGQSAREDRKQRKIKVPPGRSNVVLHDVHKPPEIFQIWQESLIKMCDGNFLGYANEFASLKRVIIEKIYCRSEKRGGEFLEDVVNQPEELEYFTYEIGCFQLDCPDNTFTRNYYFNNKNHMNDYMMGVQIHDVDLHKVNAVQKQFTILVTRYEYANIYHTMTDWYNAFMIMQFFNRTQEETNILIVDTHPRGVLDPVWRVLFHSVTRLSYLPPRALFMNVAWSIIGYNSPMLNHYTSDLPLVNEFRSFFLSSYRIPDDQKLNCGKLKVLFVWRRDYVAHPRNPRGTVSRKIHNEREIINVLQKKYPEFSIRGIQIDLFDMQQQLKFIAAADICIGMHGAGLTHALFLPAHAALIELMPNYWSLANDHFSAIATWRNLHYQRWMNEDLDNEAPNFFTRIPPAIIQGLVSNAVEGICVKNGTRRREGLPYMMDRPTFPPAMPQFLDSKEIDKSKAHLPASQPPEPAKPINTEDRGPYSFGNVPEKAGFEHKKELAKADVMKQNEVLRSNEIYPEKQSVSKRANETDLYKQMLRDNKIKQPLHGADLVKKNRHSEKQEPLKSKLHGQLAGDNLVHKTNQTLAAKQKSQNIVNYTFAPSIQEIQRNYSSHYKMSLSDNQLEPGKSVHEVVSQGKTKGSTKTKRKYVNKNALDPKTDKKGQISYMQKTNITQTKNQYLKIPHDSYSDSHIGYNQNLVRDVAAKQPLLPAYQSQLGVRKPVKQDKIEGQNIHFEPVIAQDIQQQRDSLQRLPYARPLKGSPSKARSDLPVHLPQQNLAIAPGEKLPVYPKVQQLYQQQPTVGLKSQNIQLQQPQAQVYQPQNAAVMQDVKVHYGVPKDARASQLTQGIQTMVHQPVNAQMYQHVQVQAGAGLNQGLSPNAQGKLSLDRTYDANLNGKLRQVGHAASQKLLYQGNAPDLKHPQQPQLVRQPARPLVPDQGNVNQRSDVRISDMGPRGPAPLKLEEQNQLAGQHRYPPAPVNVNPPAQNVQLQDIGQQQNQKTKLRRRKKKTVNRDPDQLNVNTNQLQAGGGNQQIYHMQQKPTNRKFQKTDQSLPGLDTRPLLSKDVNLNNHINPLGPEAPQGLPDRYPAKASRTSWQGDKEQRQVPQALEDVLKPRRTSRLKTSQADIGNNGKGAV